MWHAARPGGSREHKLAAAVRMLVFNACDRRSLLGKGLLTVMLLLPLPAALAADGTWSSSATNGDWDTATNWLPAGAPGSPGDTASFGSSAITGISLATTTELDSLIFNAGADAFTIRRAEGYSLIFSGAGVINNSAATQRFIVSPMAISSGFSALDFTGSATAGSNTEYRVEGTSSGTLFGSLRFYDRSTAGSGTFTAAGGAAGGGQITFYNSATAGAGNFSIEGANLLAGGAVTFYDRATAGNSTFRLWGSNVSDPTATGGQALFVGASSAGNSSLYAYGGMGTNRLSGSIILLDNATAGDATLYALGGSLGGFGGFIAFSDNASAGNATLITAPLPFFLDPGRISFASNAAGGTSSIQLTGKGELIIADHAGGGITVGSLEGDDTSSVLLGSRRLTVGSNDKSTLFAGALTGDGGSLGKVGSGTLSISGSNSYDGGTTVDAGLLRVDNTTGSATGSGDVLVNSGGSLGGSGSVSGQVTIIDGGRLAAGNSAGNLTLGSLLLSQASVLDYELAAPGGTPGVDSDLITVTGDLTLDGILDVTDLGGFDFGTGVGDSGRYTLFNYGGTLIDNALEFGQGLLAGYNYRIDTDSAGVVSLVAEFIGLQYWDGSSTSSDGSIAGGNGSWTATSSNWTDQSGSANARWGDLTGVFSGASGTVEIDGAQRVRGLQFVTDGYLLRDADSNGSLVLADAGADVRADSGVTATLDVALGGSGNLLKSGGGTIVLQGNGSYAGETRVHEGVLRLGASERIADTSALVVEGGTFAVGEFVETVGSLSGSGGVIDLGQTGAGRLIINQTVDGNYAGNVVGNSDLDTSSALVKEGAATLILSGTSTQIGLSAVDVNAGRLAVTGGNAIADTHYVAGTGEFELLSDETLGGLAMGNGQVLLNDSTLTLRSTALQALRNAANISGTGKVIIDGSGAQYFDSASSYTGGTTISNGLLITQNAVALGSNGGVAVNAGGELELQAGLEVGALTGAGTVKLTGARGAQTLTTGANNSSGTFSGQLSGEGGNLSKAGTGTFTLTGANSYSGVTQVNAGILLASNASGSATGTSTVSIANGAALGGSGSIAGVVSVENGELLTPGSTTETLTLGGLVLNAAALLGFELGDPDGSAGLDSDLINLVANMGGSSSSGDLTLDGILHVSDLGGFDGSGSHRLINYEGTLINNGLNLGTGFLAGYNYDVNTSVAGQVDLVVDYTGLQHWDGADGGGDGLVTGGTGIWRAGEANWTDHSGQLSAAWEDLTAVFDGASGVVEVDGDLNVNGMQFVTDGYRLEDSDGNGALLLAAVGADLRANAGVSATLDVELGGTGALIKTGAGTVVLAGNNSYSGGTTVSDGTLQGSADSLQGDIVNNAALVFDQAQDGTYAGVVSGSGTLTKVGAGSLLLVGNSSYTGGTTVLGGLLQGSSSTLQGDIANNAQVNFVQVSEGAYGGAMSGNGRLIKSGAGLLVLSGSNSYSGGTSVLEGILQGAAGSLQGDISNSAQLDFAQQTDGIHAGMISGTGNLIKSGNASLTLTGANIYSGDTLVEAGRLLVNGSIANSATTVSSGASVGGSGTFGSISLNGGTVAPGNSIGTLTVAGNLDFSGGAVYQVEADAAGNSDRIDASGSALLTGGVVQVLPEAGDYRLSTVYSILSAAGGLGGTEFGSVSSSLAFLTPTLSYDATSVSLNLRRNTSDYVSVGATANQVAVAASLDAYIASGATGSDELADNLDVLTAAGARQAYDSLSGVQHSYSNLIVLQNGRQLSGLLLDRLQVSGPPAIGIPGEEVSSQSGWWLRGTGSYAELDDAHYSASGSAVGFDAPLDEQRTLGAAFGYSRTNADLQQGGLELESYQLALYGEWRLPVDAYLSGVAGLGYHQLESSRSVAVGALSSTAEADYDAWSGQAAMELGRSFAVHQSPNSISRMTPLFGLEYAHLQRSSFAEDATAGLNLRVENDRQASLRSAMGGRLSHARLTQGGMRIEPALELAWVHEFLDTGASVDAMLVATPGNGFRVAGPKMERDRARLGVGLTMQLSDTAALELGYRGEYASTDDYHDLSATFRMAW